MFDININLVLGQMVLGMVNGVFYAILSLGVAIIFGLLGVINFAHGVFFMLGAFVAYGLLEFLGIGYWPALILVPLIVGAFGVVLEVLLIRHLYRLEHLYGLLLTLGMALAIEGFIRVVFGPQGLPYSMPATRPAPVTPASMSLPNTGLGSSSRASSCASQHGT